MSQQTTLAPSRPNSRAVARPIPLFAPVITATLPRSRPIPCRINGCSSASTSGSAAIIRPPWLFLIKLLDQTRGLHLFDQAHIDECFRIGSGGLGVARRQVVEHCFYAFRMGIRDLRKYV